jgi:endonuclease III
MINDNSTTKQAETTKMSKTDLTSLLKIFDQIMPDPQCELDYHNPYTLLVAVVLSAQSSDRSVNLVTKDLFLKADDPKKMLDLGLDTLKKHLRTLGLYQKKSQYIMNLSQKLLDHHKGQVPNNRQALEELSGVGRKSANVVLSTCFHKPVFAVDTHVFRVSQRLGLAFGNTPLALEKALMDVVPLVWVRKMHHWLVLHGRYVCKARTPQCHQCPVSHLCLFFKQHHSNQ